MSYGEGQRQLNQVDLHRMKLKWWWAAGGLGFISWVFIHFRFVFKALRMSIASGRLGPDITEKEQFANRIIKAKHAQPWQKHRDYDQLRMPAKYDQVHDRLGTAAFLVIHGSELKFEKYWPGYSPNTTINAFSVAKSVVGALIGILIEQKMVALDDTIGQLLPEIASGGKGSITIQHLLMMSSGLGWIESEVHPFSHNARAYYGNDLVSLVKELRGRRRAGEVYRYVSGNTQILAMIIQRVTNMTLSEFTEKELWSKIGCTSNAYWNLDQKNGMEKAFCCLYATPRDFARLGQLYLQEGIWNGIQLVPKDYIVQSLIPFRHLDVWRNKPNDIYGWHWWITEHHGKEFFYARGIRGQYVICQKELELVIVRMGKNRNPVDRHTGHPPDLFDHIDAGIEIIRSNPA